MKYWDGSFWRTSRILFGNPGTFHPPVSNRVYLIVPPLPRVSSNWLGVFVRAMAERSRALVLKTSVLHGTGGVESLSLCIVLTMLAPLGDDVNDLRLTETLHLVDQNTPAPVRSKFATFDSWSTSAHHWRIQGPYLIVAL